MNEKKIIDSTIEFVKEKLSGDSSGHDWWHIFRVWIMAKKIHEREGGNLFIIELAALLHDISDWKFHENEESGLQIVKDWLSFNNVVKEISNEVVQIIKKVSFKGAGVPDKMNSIEGKIVQDADRLDAIGAMGIARTFAFGGNFGNEIHNPEIKSVLHQSFDQYKKSKGTTINHFYEKLLLLKDRMNTNTAVQIAIGRHNFMESFLKQFYDEWDGLK